MRHQCRPARHKAVCHCHAAFLSHHQAILPTQPLFFPAEYSHLSLRPAQAWGPGHRPSARPRVHTSTGEAWTAAWAACESTEWGAVGVAPHVPQSSVSLPAPLAGCRLAPCTTCRLRCGGMTPTPTQQMWVLPSVYRSLGASLWVLFSLQLWLAVSAACTRCSGSALICCLHPLP